MLYKHQSWGREFDFRGLSYLPVMVFFRAYALETLRMVMMVCSWIPVARGEDFAPEINAETESNSRNMHLLVGRDSHYMVCCSVSADYVGQSVVLHNQQINS